MSRMTARRSSECAAVLAEGGRLVLFCPNRGYPFETHGIYIRGEYRFGNKFLVNYLPKKWRNRLAPHVRAYSRKDIRPACSPGFRLLLFSARSFSARMTISSSACPFWEN